MPKAMLLLLLIACYIGHIAAIPFFPGGLSRFQKYVKEEYKFRKSSIDQYREQIERFWNQSLSSFRTTQNLRYEETKKDFDSYRQRFNLLYINITNTIMEQKKWTDIQPKFTRPIQIDQSLEDFRRFYNETVYQAFVQDREKPTSSFFKRKPLFSTNGSEPFYLQLDYLNKQLTKNWDGLISLSAESRRVAEDSILDSIAEFKKIQDEVILQARLLENSTFAASNKRDLRTARAAFEQQLQHLEKDGSLWIESRLHSLEASLKSLQDRIKASESIYEELLGRKKSSLHYTLLNDMTLNKVLNMIDPNDPGWKLIKSEDGFDVYRKFMGEGSHFACVKCTGYINAPAQNIFELFEDNTRVKEYNTLFEKGRDLEIVAENTKVTWASSTPIFPFKARDFCTIVHWRKLRDGTLVILNRAVKHPDAPLYSSYVRASIILGANIIQPVPGNPRRSKLTMITQVDPGGFTPPMIVNQLCAMGPIGFMKNIEVAANKKPSKSVLQEKLRLAQELSASKSGSSKSTAVRSSSSKQQKQEVKPLYKGK